MHARRLALVLVSSVVLLAPACGGGEKEKATPSTTSSTLPANPADLIPEASQLAIDYFQRRAEDRYMEASQLATLPLAAEASYLGYLRFVDASQAPAPSTAEVVPAFFDAHDQGGGTYALDGTITVRFPDGSPPARYEGFVVTLDRGVLKVADFADDEGPVARRTLAYDKARRFDSGAGVSAGLEAAVASFASGSESVGYALRIFDKSGVDKRFAEGQPFSVTLGDGTSLNPDFFGYKPEDERGQTVDVVVEFHGDKAPRVAKGGTWQAALVTGDGAPALTVKLDLPPFPS